MACKGFSTCYGYGCGGGAVEQTAVGYSDYPMTTTGDSGRGPHPKCQIPPETFSFEIGGWHGSLEMVGAMGELDRINVGCQHSNCSCPDPKCKCMRTDMAGNTNFQGHMQTKDCLDQGHCINPDMTVTGCCEDPVTGVKPNIKTGFGTGLNQDECACRGGTWSSWCDAWTQDELDTCNKCVSSCPPYKIGNSIGLGFEYSQGCLQAPVPIDADGNRCCCSGDSPICDSCPNHCVVWQGHTENTCGPPVLYCDEDSCGPERKPNNLGYGVTIPWELTLVCIAPAKTAHGHLQYPPDYGSWLLHVVAWRPVEDNVLGTEPCRQWTFGNKHGVASDDGFLDLGSACKDGSWTISVDIPVQPDEIKTSCGCECPCREQITNVFDGEECDCFKPDCVTDGFECLHGTKEPPDCDASCLEPIPACPAANALWAGLQAPHQYCNDGKGNKPELMGMIENLCQACCKPCNEFCEDQCVCEEAQAKVGPSSICGTKTLSNRNIAGHGCSKDPKPSFPGSTSTPKEGDCCNHHYGTPTGETSLHTDCIWESYYECGCLSEDEANGGTIQLTIQANAQRGSTITTLSHYEDQNGNSGTGLGFTPVGSDTPGKTINECGAVDAICDLSLKHPDTDGCRYTKWPDPSCETPPPPPDIREGVRCPNSLVWEQPTYGYQCTLPGGSNNGAMGADFPVKPGLCLNARPERWHLRPQFTHPHLWAICHKPGPGEPAPPCDQPADRDAECVEHPEVTRFVADIGNIHGTIGECNIYCEGWWEVVVDCFRAWTLDLCEACLGDCWTDAKIVGAKPWCCGHCDEGDHSSDWGCDGKWPGIFPFLYYHPPEDIFCPYGEYFPAISCPTVPNSPAATMLGQSGQLYYPGNITKKWTSCCGNQPAGCECCYPCGHPAYDPTCRIRNLISGNICDICWECMCNNSKSEGINANQVYMSNDCPNGCQQPDWPAPPASLTTGTIQCSSGMDVVFAIDITGSMVSQVEAIRADVDRYVNIIDEASDGNYRLGLVTFKEDSADTITHTSLGYENAISFEQALDSLEPAGGSGSLAEAHVDGVRSILDGDVGSWIEKEDHRKIIIVMTDVEPNEGYEAADVQAQRAKEQGVIISSILFIPISGEDEDEAARSLENYATVTGGVFGKSTARGTGDAIQHSLSMCQGVTLAATSSAGGGEPTGQCIQVVQDGGGEVAGCGQFMQEMGDIPETCPAPIYCPEGLIPYNKYGGGYCHEGDFCCQCLREKSHWLAVPATRRIGPTTNQLGWKLGAPVLYDMAWYPLKEAVCILEPCGMGESGEGEQPGGGPGEPPVLYDKGSIKVSVTLMREGTSTEVGEALKIHDHQSTGEIIGVTGKGQPVKITSRIQVGQLEINLAPGDPVFIGIMNDTQGKPFGSKVGGNNAANGQFVVLAVSGNEFTIALPGGGPVIGDGDWTDGGTWHYYDPNDAGASCTGPHQQCAYSFEFDRGGVNVGTSPKVLPEALFIECVEEAFVEWSNILESLWSPRADYTATGRRHGSWASGGSSPSDPQHPFPGSHNINPGLTPQGSPGPQANSHQLRARFINLGHEPAISNEVPSNKVDRYNVAEWSRATNYPLVGRCVTRLPGGDTAGGVVPERRWENMASCITNGHCYAKGCSANDMRATSVQLSSSNKCEEMAHAASGTSYDNPKDCLSTKYYACLTHPKIEVLRWISGEAFGDPVDSDADGAADLFPDVPLRWYLDPKYVREDIGDEDCCNHVDGYWEEIEGDWSSDFGNGQGIFNPGFSELFPCIPKSAECCQGTVSCVSPAGDHFLTPTNTYVPSSCCKEYEQKYGQCLGDYNLDGIMDEMAGCDYDCCGFGLAGWCVDKNDPNNIYWSTASCPGCGGKDACDKGSGLARRGCTETLSVCGDGKPTTVGTDAQTCAPLRWQQTQRVLKNDIGTAGSFEIALRFPGSNIGDPLERTDCDLTDSLLFAVGDFIKIGNEYMEVTSSNLTTNKLSVTRGVGGFGADPSSSFRTGHSAGDSIYLWLNDTPGTENCDDVAHCVDNDGYLIGDANEGIGYFPIDNRSLYHLCRDGDRRSVYSDTCGTGGSCWIAGEAGTGSSRGVPIGISSLYNSVSSSDTIITITEIDNTGNLFVDDGNDVHNPSIIATPEKFKLKIGDIIRIEAENMEVVAVRKTSEFHASVKGDCTADVKLNGLFGAPTNGVPECEFIDCDGGDRQTDCRHWYRKDHDQAIGWSNCIGAPLGDIEWPDKIVSLYEITVRRGEDGTSAVDHDANKWVRKKYGNVINDCRQCEDNLMGTAYRHEWVGTGTAGPTNPAGSIWRRARWYPKFDWTANIWEAKISLDTPFYGKTGGECLEWPEKDDCCPRIGQVRVGMVNWYDALRERWANEGKGQCYDCNTGVIIGNQTKFGPNSVELHGECLRYNEDRYDKLLIGSTSDSQDDCLDLNCNQPLNSCGGVCINSQNQEITTYTTEEDCISNNLIWATWTWSAYVNKDVCNNAGHCWDYRDPPLVPASGNPFACGYMGGMKCMRQLPDGVWVSCLPRAGAPYGKANNMIGVDRDLELMYPELGKNCVGFRPQVGGNVIPAQPGGGDPPDAPSTGGEPCKCITEGKEGIAGDLYIDSSVKWRPDWVPEYDKPGAYSIKRVLMKQIGHMLGLPAGQDVMGPITGPADDAVPIGRSTYNKLVEMYEPRWWNRGGRNDYWWVSGVYAGDFK